LGSDLERWVSAIIGPLAENRPEETLRDSLYDSIFISRMRL